MILPYNESRDNRQQILELLELGPGSAISGQLQPGMIESKSQGRWHAPD